MIPAAWSEPRGGAIGRVVESFMVTDDVDTVPCVTSHRLLFSDMLDLLGCPTVTWMGGVFRGRGVWIAAPYLPGGDGNPVAVDSKGGVSVRGGMLVMSVGPGGGPVSIDAELAAELPEAVVMACHRIPGGWCDTYTVEGVDVVWEGTR